MRPSGREPQQLRPIKLTSNYTQHAEGSVLVEFGNTRVLCTASIDENVPRFLRKSGKGWLTAEYGMLPRATHDRMDREATRGKQSGRTLEIQRLIGRSLRAALDLSKLGERTIYIDCDVIQADGGTRTASITGACLALAQAVTRLPENVKNKGPIFKQFIASVSVGMFKDNIVLDLDYAEDSSANTDMNVIMNEHGGFIEVQGTAEGDQSFSKSELDQMLAYADAGIRELIEKQKQAMAEFL